MNLTRPVAIVAALLIAAGITACGTNEDPSDTLRLGAIATDAAPKEKARYEAVAEQLSRSLDREVDLVISTDYFAIAEGLRGGRIDVAFLNSLGYVLTNSMVDIEPLAAGIDETGEPGYFSYLITTKPDEIKSPGDVRGRNLALASSLSTSGYLFPLEALQAAGLDPEQDTTLLAGGDHASNILAVASGQVDAAFVDSVEYESAVKDGDVDPEQVVKVWQSERITGSPVVARAELDSGLLDDIRAAVLDLEGTEEFPLGVEKTLRMGEVSPQDYDPIRELAKRVGLSIDDMKK